jgi:hypothetical protein
MAVEARQRETGMAALVWLEGEEGRGEPRGPKDQTDRRVAGPTGPKFEGKFFLE